MTHVLLKYIYNSFAYNNTCLVIFIIVKAKSADVSSQL